MIFRYPKYYEKFQCIADRCQDTCCAGWEIDIDDASYEYYMSVEGEFGERLRRCIKEYESQEEDVYENHGFILKEGRRCPFLDDNNLCDLYRELGEEALCDVCTDTPRNYLEYGGQREMCLSPSCAEAGRLLYEDETAISFVEKEIDEGLDFDETEEELLLAKQIRRARDNSISILQNRDFSLQQRAIAFLQYAEEVQKHLNEDDAEGIEEIKKEAFLHSSTVVDCKGRMEDIYNAMLGRMRSFSLLESISEEWEKMLQYICCRYVECEKGKENYKLDRVGLWREMEGQGRQYEYEHMLVYYSFLCLARCVDDYDFLGKAKLVVTSFLMIYDMDCALYARQSGVFTKANRIDTTRIYAKEVEHSGENMECLADDFLFEDAYTVENLCLALTIA